MSVPETNIPISTATDSSARATDDSKATATAKTAKEQASQLGSDVGEQAKAVAGQASQQAKATMDTARQQARRLARQTQDEVLAQADDKSSQAAAGLQSLAGQLQAVADGRTYDAGPLTGYAQQAADRIGAMADRLNTGGARGLLDDVTDLARRKPGLFLAGAVAAGFLTGRIVRSGKAAMDEQGSSTGSPELEPPTTPPMISSMPTTSAVTADVPPMPPTGLGGDVTALTAELP